MNDYLIMSNEMKSGNYDLSKVTTIAKLRLKKLDEERSLNSVSSRREALKVDFSSKPNFLMQKLR